MCIRLICKVVLFATLAYPCYAQREQQAQACNGDLVFGSARNLLAGKQYDQAAKALDTVRRCPGLSNIQTFEMGWLYGRARRFDVSLEIFDKLPADVPDRLTHGYAVALARFELSDFRGTVDTLTALHGAGISDPNSMNLLAVSYSKLGLYRQAYEVLANQAETTPGDLTAWLNLVTVCAEGGDYAKASEVAEKAVQLFPETPDVFVVRGAAKMLLGRVDKSSDDFATAVRLAPAMPDARFFLAMTKYQSGDFAGALAVLRSAAKAGIADADLHYLAAECLLKIDPANTAPPLEELNIAIGSNAASVAARILRGKLLLQARRPNEAVADLEIARKADPESRSAVYNLARAYRALGRTAEAQSLLGQLKPESPQPTAADSESDDALIQEYTQHRLSQAVLGHGDQPK